MSQSKLDTILWDVDGTLLDFHYSQRYAITKCFQDIGLNITEDIIRRYDQINDSCWKRLEIREITRDELLPGRFITLFEEYNIRNVDIKAFLAQYQDALGSVYSYLDHSEDICLLLKRDFKQYIVTNGVALTQRKKLGLSGFDKLMEDIFISEEIGADKPDKKFFDACFARMSGVKKENVIIVGDSLSSDILGGIQAGIRTCWYNPERKKGNVQIRPDYEIQELKELYDVLGIRLS